MACLSKMDGATLMSDHEHFDEEDEGFRILLPYDLEKLESISGKFLYIPE